MVALEDEVAEPAERVLIVPVIVTRPIVETVAMRSPATMSGTASGSSTRQQPLPAR